MSDIARRSFGLAKRLLNAARGSYIPGTARGLPRSAVAPLEAAPLPCFPLHSSHIGRISASTVDPPTPADFHQCLCRKIRSAQHRVHLASLYVGAGTGEREQELLDALSNVPSHVQVKVLLDENRALRPVSRNDHTENKTSSAKAVYKCLKERSDGGLYLFQALPESRRLFLPSPLNEVAGVFHIKAYIVDDELILSGANLSEEYFDDRQDRYMLFQRGGGGLVNFYANLVDALCRYGKHYRGSSSSVLLPKRISSGKMELMGSLSRLMDGSTDSEAREEGEYWTKDTDVVAYAVPTVQVPLGFFDSELPFPPDAELTRRLLWTAHESGSATAQLSSAYLNPTEATMNLLSQLRHVSLLTAGPKSHGFAPKPGRPRRGDFVPAIFDALSRDIADRLSHAELLFFERAGWTFHAKGLWVHCQLESQKQDYLAAAMVGSGNFGARSEMMDVESNCILVFPQETSELQTLLQDEWRSMCHYARDKVEVEEASSWKIRAALPYIRRLF